MEKVQKSWTGSKLPGESFLNFDTPSVDFEKAKKAALERVKKYDTDPMLLAWYDKKTGMVSPSESCEEEGGHPGWVSYAKTPILFFRDG